MSVLAQYQIAWRTILQNHFGVLQVVTLHFGAGLIGAMS